VIVILIEGTPLVILTTLVAIWSQPGTGVAVAVGVKVMVGVKVVVGVRVSVGVRVGV